MNDENECNQAAENEAAFIDGASRFRIYWDIDISLAKSSLIVVGLFTFTGTWNDFMGPQLYINNPDKQTVAVALQGLPGKYTSRWNVIMTASVVVTMPCFIIFLIGQKHIIVYLTGGIGQPAGIEGFTQDYHKPNLTAYCETCASIGMALWNHRMSLLNGESIYADIVERELYTASDSLFLLG